jgi:hypothetical protein
MLTTKYIASDKIVEKSIKWGMILGSFRKEKMNSSAQFKIFYSENKRRHL